MEISNRLGAIILKDVRNVEGDVKIAPKKLARRIDQLEPMAGIKDRDDEARV